MLAVLFGILWFQARYVWKIRNPMYGWPMPFNNVWYKGWQRDWLPWLLFDDAIVWLALVGAVGYTLEQWRRKPKRLQFTLGGLLVLPGVVAIVLTLGGAEAYLRAHPNIFMIVPLYARLDLGSVSLWFDIGLFTDPLGCWPLSRFLVIFAIGCFAYMAISLLVTVARRACGAEAANTPQQITEVPHGDPPLVRLLLITFAILVFLFSLVTILPPAVR